MSSEDDASLDKKGEKDKDSDEEEDDDDAEDDSSESGKKKLERQYNERMSENLYQSKTNRYMESH